MTTVYEVETDHNRSFWIIATSPQRAITKLKRRAKRLLDRGEKIKGVSTAGTIDIE